MKTEEDDEFERIKMESGWRKRQVQAVVEDDDDIQVYKKPWVGLTDEETERLIHNFGADPWTLLDEVNARLKARNT